MKLAVDTFRGEQPRTSPRNLPVNGAQVAVNCRLQTGDLESWRQFLLTKALANSGPVQTIYLLKDAWLSWNQQVDVARGVIAGDNTFRVYLTSPGLYATPRFTNYAMATTGAEPFPVATRPLGVRSPDTVPTILSKLGSGVPNALYDTGNQLGSWNISPTSGVGLDEKSVSVDAASGYPVAPSYKLRGGNTTGSTFMYRDTGISRSALATFACSFRMTAGGAFPVAGWRVFCSEFGAGCYVKINAAFGSTQGLQLTIGTAPTWSDQGAILGSIPVVMDGTGTVWYSMFVQVDRDRNGGATFVKVRLNNADNTANIALLEAFGSFTNGGYCGVFNLDDQGGISTVTQTNYDLFVATGSTLLDTSEKTATSYVYTFKNDIGEESAPSLPSATVQHGGGLEITVTTPTTVPVGTDPTSGITTKVIYRAVTGSTGTAYIMVVEIPLAQADYVDTLTDAAISGNDVLESDDWDLPPDGLQGIIALPNGIMAGFYRNELCLSEQGRPHAWPVRYRLPVDTDIVAISNIDNTVVIGTKKFLYTATGNDPASYSMSKPGDPQACVSKMSMVFMPDVGGAGGVAYASPDGWIVCGGSAGQVSNAGSTIFTKRQWAALGPDSMIARVHDGVLFFFSTGQTPDAGYALDTNNGGFGLVQLSFHATAMHVDPATDALYLVLDVNSEPTAPGLLPLPSTAVVPNGTSIYQFDAGASNMVYRWRGRLNLAPYPLSLLMAQVRALDFTNLLLRVYANGALVHERVLNSAREFSLPAQAAYESYEFELIGTSSARSMQAVEDVMEFG